MAKFSCNWKLRSRSVHQLQRRPALPTVRERRVAPLSSSPVSRDPLFELQASLITSFHHIHASPAHTTHTSPVLHADHLILQRPSHVVKASRQHQRRYRSSTKHVAGSLPPWYDGGPETDCVRCPMQKPAPDKAAEMMHRAGAPVHWVTGRRALRRPMYSRPGGQGGRGHAAKAIPSP
jgi:hypothetical protein